MIDEFQKKVLQNIKIENYFDLIEMMDIIFPGHSIEEDNDGQVIIYCDLKQSHRNTLIRLDDEDLIPTETIVVGGDAFDCPELYEDWDTGHKG